MRNLRAIIGIMRKYSHVATAFILLMGLPNVALGMTLTSSKVLVHDGDIVVSGEEVFVIEGYFEQSGNIIVSENGKLVVKSATLVIAQESGLPYSVTVRDNGSFEVDNSEVTTTLHTHFTLRDNAVMNVCSSNLRIAIETKNQSSLNVLNSQLGAVYSYDSSNVTAYGSEVSDFTVLDSATLSIHNSSSVGIVSQNQAVVTIHETQVSLCFWASESVTAYSFNSTISQLCVSGNSRVYLDRSSSYQIIVSGAANVLFDDQSEVKFLKLKIANRRLVLSEIKEGFIEHSNFYSEPHGCNITFETSTLNSLQIEATDTSIVIINNSAISLIRLWGSSSVIIYNSQIRTLVSYGKSIAILFNSRVNHISRHDEGRIIKLSGGLSPYIVYGILGLVILSFITAAFLFIFRLKRKKQSDK